MKKHRSTLRAVPTGFEHFDLLWSELIPNAARHVANLPRSADPAWASAQGLRFVAISLFEQWTAADELRRTPTHSTLHRLRMRNLRMREKQYQGQVMTLVGALVDQARKQHPRATPAQLLTLARDAFKDLWGEAFAFDCERPNADRSRK